MSEHFHSLTVTPKITETIDVVAPFNQQTIAKVDAEGMEGIDAALATAHALYEDKKNWLPPQERIGILTRAAEILHERSEALAIAAAEEGGKPLVDSRAELARAVDGLKSCVEVMRTHSGREIPMNLNDASAHHLAVTRREPIGVVVALSAFNHPMNLIVHQVGPAIAAGCPVIVKPASDTPLSCFRFVRILREAGLPDAWCQALLTDNNDTATALASDARVGFLSFIGSARVGWMLRSKLAPGTRCALEHGGVAPVIVAADAVMDKTLPMLTKAGFYHAGQVCVSVQRVFAHESIARHLAEQLATQAKALSVGDPTLDDTDVGPLIRPKEVSRVHEWVEQARQAGGEILCGGEILSDTTYAPTVIWSPPGDIEVSCSEIFGPVVVVYPFSDLDEALQRANELEFAFQSAVFTESIDTAMYCYQHFDASAVMVNDSTAFRVDWMPFAGLKHSGYGTGGIVYSYEDMSVEKLLVVKSPGLP